MDAIDRVNSRLIASPLSAEFGCVGLSSIKDGGHSSTMKMSILPMHN